MRQGIRSSTRVSCHDCGNQAKRDCVYIRCRTCCKTRGFHCKTHVKSTWVPAYRRSRHTHHHHHQQLMFDDVSATQQFRDDHRQENIITTSGLEDRPIMFPPEITSPAVFHSVVVRSSDTNVIEHYAYQTTVTIGGHLFKGILYDQGPDDHNQHHSSSTPFRYPSGEGPSSSISTPSERLLESRVLTSATIRQRSSAAFTSQFQSQLGVSAISSNVASGTHVFFHQSS